MSVVHAVNVLITSINKEEDSGLEQLSNFKSTLVHISAERYENMCKRTVKGGIMK